MVEHLECLVYYQVLLAIVVNRTFTLVGGGGVGGGGGHAYSLISEIFPIYGIGNELVKPYQLSRGL